jgi:hypothetical protein
VLKGYGLQAPRAAFLIRAPHRIRAIGLAKLRNHLIHGPGKLAREPVNPKLIILGEVILTEGRVIAIDDLLEILVDYHAGGREGGNVTVKRAERGVKVRG